MSKMNEITQNLINNETKEKKEETLCVRKLPKKGIKTLISLVH